MDRRLVAISKRLAFHLRHDPGSADLDMDPAGWVDVHALASALGIGRDEIVAAIEAGTKRRFELSSDGQRIRARYGHSISVALGYCPTVPPNVLYHGTAATNLPRILHEGLLPQARQCVHLSATRTEALTVGRRHGPPAVVQVDAAAMHADGSTFFRADEGIWLVERVPARYLSRHGDGAAPTEGPAPQ